MKRVAVIGAGLAGLTAAADLIRGGVEVTIFEGTQHLGGQVRTRREGGFVIEDGAEGWVAADTVVPALCEALGLTNDLVLQLERRSLLFSGGHLNELGAGDAARKLGIQAGEADLGRGIASLRHGMGSLVAALADWLRPRATIHTGVTVRGLRKRKNRVEIADQRGAAKDFDGAVLALTGPAAARLIDPLAPAAAVALANIEHASNLSVSLAYDRTAVAHPLDASGLVVDSREDLEGLRACAFPSSKLPHRAPPDKVLLRGFFRPTAMSIAQDEATWIARAVRLLGPILRLSASPLNAWVARWPAALPQYASAHEQLVDDVAEQLRGLGKLELAGASFHRGGVPGAVRSGHHAAKRILA